MASSPSRRGARWPRPAAHGRHLASLTSGALLAASPRRRSSESIAHDACSPSSLVARLQEERLLFAGEREVEAARLKELFRRRNRHHLQDPLVAGAVDAGFDQPLSHAATLMARPDDQAPHFGELAGIDF